VVPDGKETAAARAGKLRPFHKVPRERDIDTIPMWVIEPSIPIKMCFRRTPQFVVMRHRAGIPSWTCWTLKFGPSSGEAEAEIGGTPHVGITLVWARSPPMPIKFGVKRPSATHISQSLNASAIVFHRVSFDLYAAGFC
jgi:hypothetical protein